MSTELYTLEKAADFNTSAQELRTLAKHASPKVRALVAANLNCDAETLLLLVGDSDEKVLEALSTHAPSFDGRDYEFSACKKSKFSLADEKDAEFIVSLRQNPELNRYISQVDSDIGQQVLWLKNYKEREKRREEFYFIIRDNQNKPLGAVRLYDFQKGSFCWGSWVVAPGSPRKTAIESAINVYEFAYKILNFSQAHFQVRHDNVRVIDFHNRMGAQEISHNEIEKNFIFTRAAYEATREQYAVFLQESNSKSLVPG